MPTVFQLAEIENLAVRLHSRGTSKLFDDSPSMQADMRAASRVIRALLGKLEAAQLLANLRLEVED